MQNQQIKISGPTKKQLDASYEKFLKRVDETGKFIYGVREWNKIKKEFYGKAASRK